MRRTHRPGFTLIEIIATLVITGIVAMAFFSSLVYGVQQYIQSYQTASLAQKARLALTRMHVELLEISDIDPVLAINIDDKHFYYIDRNGVAGSLALADDEIVMNGQFTLVDGVTALDNGQALFTYRNGAGETWNPNDGFDTLFEIAITLPLETQNNASIEFTHTVNPRNSLNANAPKLN